AWEDMGLPVGSRGIAVARNTGDIVVAAQVPPLTYHDYHVFRRSGGAWVDLPPPFAPNDAYCGNLFVFDDAIYATNYGPGGGIGGWNISGVARLTGSQW